MAASVLPPGAVTVVRAARRVWSSHVASHASSLPMCLPPEAQENGDTLPDTLPGAFWGSPARYPDSPHRTSELGSDPAIRTRVNAATCWKPHGPAASRQLLRRMLKEDSKKSKTGDISRFPDTLKEMSVTEEVSIMEESFEEKRSPAEESDFLSWPVCFYPLLVNSTC